jgi:hypothetical protein
VDFELSEPHPKLVEWAGSTVEVFRHPEKTHHRSKLQRLQQAVARRAIRLNDILMFLDGDAFPIADLHELVEKVGEHKFIAVYRDTDNNEALPHPSFALADYGWWMDNGGTWTLGGHKAFWSRVKKKTDWIPLRRTGGSKRHKLFFGVYGDVVYHHGAGFREPLTMSTEHRLPPEERKARLATNRRLSNQVYQNILSGRDFWEGL